LKKHLKRTISTNYIVKKANKSSDFGFPYFTTKNGKRINLIKTPSNFFDKDPVLNNREYEFAFMSNGEFKEIKGTSVDYMIGKTIMRFIKKILNEEPNKIIIYNCTDADNRRGSRAKLFERWFNEYTDSNYYMANFNDKEYTYHFAVMLSKDNKDFDLFMSEINSFFV
jgi:hypothetical protein